MSEHGESEGVNGGHAPAARNEFEGEADAVVQVGGNVSGDVTIHNHGTIHNDGTIHNHERSAPIPRWHPSALSFFANRREELSQARPLLDVDERRPPRIAVFSGLPGVGKSATVRQLVGTSERQHKGGVLYIDFADFRGPKSTGVGDALASVLHSFGVRNEAMPARIAERAKLYRSYTADCPVLVVLDEVTEPAQVESLVPNSPGSTVLVTSNENLTELVVDGATPVRLAPLDAADGAAFLQEVCGDARTLAEPEAVAELVELCDGLPAALRTAAQRLLARRRLSVAALVEELAVRERGLRGFANRGKPTLSAIFDLVYLDLPASEALLYRRLALLPQRTLTVELAAVLADCDSATASVLLEGLVETSLVDEDGPDGYRIHGLAQRHAYDRGQHDDPESERESAQYRLVRHYLVHSAAADLAVLGPARLRFTTGGDELFTGQDRKVRALEWMDSRRSGLIAAVRLAEEHHWDEQAWQLAESSTALYLNRRYLADWVETTDLGARAARRAQRPDVEARLRSFVSRAFDDLGEHARAKSALDEALPVAESSGNQRLLASVWELFGRHYDRTDSAAAIGAYEHTIRLFAEVDDRRGVAFVTYFLGCSMDAAGRPAEAITTLDRALELIREVGDERMAGRALLSVGVAHKHLGDHERATDSLRRARENLAAGGYSHYEAQAHEALADVRADLGDRVGERDSLAAALEIHLAAGNPKGEQLRARLERLGE